MNVLHQVTRMMPWYSGPDWPSHLEMSYGWMTLALIVTASALMCWIEFGAWRFGYHTISYLSQQRPVLRWVVFAFIIVGALGVARVWLQHTNGSYGGS
jgi:hypothetical protein